MTCCEHYSACLVSPTRGKFLYDEVWFKKVCLPVRTVSLPQKRSVRPLDVLFFLLKTSQGRKKFWNPLAQWVSTSRFQLPSLKYYLPNRHTMFMAYQLARRVRLDLSQSNIFLTWAIGPGLFLPCIKDVSVIRPGCQLHDLVLFYFLPANFAINTLNSFLTWCCLWCWCHGGISSIKSTVWSSLQISFHLSICSGGYYQFLV